MPNQESILEAKVLIVEDDFLSGTLLEKMLQEAGLHRIKVLNDSRQALEEFKTFQPDLVILDLSMPHLTGFDIMEQLHEFTEGEYLPILVITSHEDNETHVQALKCGAKDFLNKPYDRTQVVLRCQNLLEARIFYNQLHQHNLSLEKQVQYRTKELKNTRLDVIRRLGRAAEYRDSTTGEHIERMSLYCEALAKAYGMSEAQCELMLTTAPLHDIGKLAIPDQILQKPGKLTKDEFEVMKTHTTIGADILSGSDSIVLKTAETIALTHHERWDGSGYPRGLSKDDIPIVGRICCLCDVFDALTSVRPYKKAWSISEAVEEINNGRGQHFDPELTNLFLSILPEITAIKEKYSDQK